MMIERLPTRQYARAIAVIYLGVALATIVIFLVAVALCVRPIETLGMLSAIATIGVLLGRSLRLDDARSSLMRAIGSAHHPSHH
jgi:hypothetical protein